MKVGATKMKMDNKPGETLLGPLQVLGVLTFLATLYPVYNLVVGFVHPSRNSVSPAWWVLLAALLLVASVLTWPASQRRTVAWQCLLVIAVFAGLGWFFSGAFGGDNRERSARIACLSNVKQIGVARLLYATDYDDKIMPAAHWEDALYPYLKNRQVYKCPIRPDDHPAYALNSTVAGKPAKTIDEAQTPQYFESTLESGGQQNFLTPHEDMGLIGFVDSHAKAYSRKYAQTLNWQGTKK